MKAIILSTAMCVLSAVAFSQKNLKGKVMDAATGKPLAGASVSFSSKDGTVTGNDGTFSVNCNTTSRITISFVGYAAHTQMIKDCDAELQVSLTPVGKPLEEVELSATSNSNKSVLYQPLSITKLTPKELKRGQGIFFDDVIQTSVPGVIMNRRTVSGGQQFNIRGYGNGSRGTRGISSNFDGQGYKVYLNGIPVTDAEGITTLDDIDYASIGNAEIVKGPAGTLYGQAISGAINFKINSPERGKSSLEQQVTIGNYGLQRYTTLLRTATEKSGILLAYGKQNSDGFSIHNSSHKDFVNFVGDFQASEKQTITTFVGYTDSYDERLGELTLTQWAAKDYSGNIEYIKRNAHSHVSTFRAGLAHTYNFSKAVSNTTSIFGMGFRSDASSAGGWTDKTSVNYGFRTSFDTKFSLGSGSTLSGITGLEVQRQDAQITGYNMKADPSDPNPGGPWVYGTSPYWIVNAVTSNNAFVTTPTAYFTEWTLGLAHDLSVTAGIGLSSQGIILDDRFSSPNATVARPSHFDTSYTNMWSPHVAINKVINKNASVYVSYSSGYKAPVSSYFFIATPQIGTPPNAGSAPAKAMVNGELKPEKGNQFEIGAKGSILKDKLIYQVALFSLDFTDKMTAVAVPVPTTTPPATATAYSYMINGGEQNHKGLEALVKYSIVKDRTGVFTNVTPFVNFTYSDFKYADNFVYKTGTTTAAGGIDTVNYSGLDVFGVPKIMAACGVDVSTKYGIYASVSYLYKDPQNIALERLTNNPETYALRKATSYSLLNTKVGIKRNLSSKFDLDVFFGVNNITNQQYPIMIFVNQLPDAYIPAPPKAVVFGGLNLKYTL
ncbi:MAG: TonB-dependent receptor [Bacteroidetes bacterium]|nr:MAG: TonB-dependent receptor [Bacteroidota bacterium]